MKGNVSPGVAGVLVVLVLAIVLFFAWKVFGPSGKAPSSASKEEVMRQKIQEQMNKRNARPGMGSGMPGGMGSGMPNQPPGPAGSPP